MSLTIDPQSKNYGTVFSAPEISVDVVESDGLNIHGVATFKDSTNTTVLTETFDSIGRHRFQPDLSDKWNEAADGAANVQLTVTSYEEIPEEPLNGSESSLYISPKKVEYTGSQICPTIFGYDNNKMEITGTDSATNVGTYTIQIRPKSGYYWSTAPAGVGKYDWITLTWQITKGMGYMMIAGTKVYNYYDITFNSLYDSGQWYLGYSSGQVSMVSTSDSSVVNTSFSSNYLMATCMGRGATTATFSIAESDNCYGITVVIRYNCPIESKTINSVPTPSPSSFSYNGMYQSPSFIGYDSSKMQIGGVTEAMAIGSYYATFTPINGYTWWDGRTDTKYVMWYIEQAYTPPAPVYSESVTMSPSSVTVSYTNDTYGYVTFQNNTSKTLEVSYGTGTSGYGPHASFNTSDRTGSIYASTTLSAYQSARAKIFAGAPPSLIGRDCYINWYIKENNSTIETKRLSVTNT